MFPANTASATPAFTSGKWKAKYRGMAVSEAKRLNQTIVSGKIDPRASAVLWVGAIDDNVIPETAALKLNPRRFDEAVRLCLSFGALPRVSVQAKGKDEGDQTLTRPVKRSAVSRSVPRR
jgi:hypothetical protein